MTEADDRAARAHFRAFFEQTRAAMNEQRPWEVYDFDRVKARWKEIRGGEPMAEISFDAQEEAERELDRRQLAALAEYAAKVAHQRLMGALAGITGLLILAGIIVAALVWGKKAALYWALCSAGASFLSYWVQADAVFKPVGWTKRAIWPVSILSDVFAVLALILL